MTGSSEEYEGSTYRFPSEQVDTDLTDYETVVFNALCDGHTVVEELADATNLPAERTEEIVNALRMKLPAVRRDGRGDNREWQYTVMQHEL